ncbi:MAG: hypothetical protein WBG86_17735 [Polyangiales bacterium]
MIQRMIQVCSAFAMVFVVSTSLGCEVTQTKEGEMPDVEVEEGQMPAYDVDTAEIDVNMEQKEVEVPDVDVKMEKTKIEVPDVDVKMPGEDGKAVQEKD